MLDRIKHLWCIITQDYAWLVIDLDIDGEFSSFDVECTKCGYEKDMLD